MSYLLSIFCENLISDDGGDWGLNSPSTAHNFGRLFRDGDFESLIILKFAPGASKYNASEFFLNFSCVVFSSDFYSRKKLE